jgi:F0F1-type ATP synthase delta subunit
VFEFLGVPTIEWDNVEIEEFKEIVRNFNDIQSKPELVNTLEIDGYTYTAFEDKFKLSVKDTKHIEKIMHSKHKGYISELLAVLFKRTDLTKAEHYVDAHIKLKAKMIRELKAELAVPYLVEIGQKLSKQMPKDVPTEIME